MPETAMTRSTARSLAQLIVIGMAVQLAVIGYVFYTSYSGRSALVKSQRAGCERGKMDRAANGEGWRIAEFARRSSGQTQVADRYAKIAQGLERRAIIKCEVVYPKASLLP